MEVWLKIIKGFIIGIMVSVPLGPIGIIIIQRTLNRGWLSGFSSGLGAATADLLYAIIAATGLGIIIQLVNDHIHILKIITFCVITVIGFFISKKSVRKLRQERAKSSSLFTDFLSIFLLTFSNPLVLGVFLALFTGAANKEDASVRSIILILLGVFLGALFWWLTLTISISLFRHKFRFRNLFWINKITGVVIFILGIAGLLYTITEALVA